MYSEVVVVGSGFGAAPPALRLAKAGFQVMMIEKGPDIVPKRDFRQSQDPMYLLKYIKTVRGDTVNFIYGEGLGGGSGFYEMVSLRAPSIAFAQTSHDGTRLWPVGLERSTMNPYYEIAEREMHVTQIAPHEVPKTGLAFAQLMTQLGYSVDRAPYAVRGCTGRAFCIAGCTGGAKVTLHDTYLDPACEAGATIMTGVEAVSISPIRDVDSHDHSERVITRIPYRYQVLCRHTETGESFSVRAKILVLAGGTVGTARLLLRSRHWLPELSPQLGLNIAVNGTVKSLGILPENMLLGDMFSGRSHPGVICYDFLQSRGITISTAKPLPVDSVAYANFEVEGETRPHPWWGEAKVDLMRLYRHRAMVVFALGLTTPRASLHLTRNGEVIPRFHLDNEFREYFHSTLALLQSILRRNGAKVVAVKVIDGQGAEHSDLHITTAHMTGSCRMADSPRSGVVDVSGEAFGYPGLFVTDGASIPSSLAVNPYLTILANAERITDFMLQWYTRGEARIVRVREDEHHGEPA